MKLHFARGFLAVVVVAALAALAKPLRAGGYCAHQTCFGSACYLRPDYMCQLYPLNPGACKTYQCIRHDF